MRRAPPVFALLALLTLVACSGGQPPMEGAVIQPSRTVTLVSETGNRIAIDAEIADEPEARAVGLMFRKEVPEGHGMLFVFEREEEMGFWMKNTLVPLDIIFFDAEGNFVSSTTMEPCIADPCPGYPSGGAAMYALELPAGFMERQKIDSGWHLEEDQIR